VRAEADAAAEAAKGASTGASGATSSSRRKAKAKAKEKEREKELGVPLTFTPLRQGATSESQAPTPTQGKAETLVSQSGARIRIKPPHPPAQHSPPEGPHSPVEGRHTHHFAPAHPQTGAPPHSRYGAPPPGYASPRGHGHGMAYSQSYPPPEDMHHGPPHATHSPHDPRSPPQYQGPTPGELYRRDSIGSVGTPPYHAPSENGNGNGSTHAGEPPVHRQAKPKRLKAHTVTSKVMSACALRVCEGDN
jgi:hypothetical protein